MPTEQLRQHGEKLTDVELASRLNGLLRDSQIQLDFTGVLEVSGDFVHKLLDTLDLGRVGENLGAETMSAEVATAFEQHGAAAEAPAEAEIPVVMRQDILNPITVLAETIRNYRDYLVTEFRARDDVLRRKLEDRLKDSGFLAQEPYFSTHIPFKQGKLWRELPLDSKLAAALARRTKGKPTYLHQQEAVEHLLGPNVSPLVVTTGTGSGKTECFLAPLLQAAIEDAVRQRGAPGVVGLILYPMNALANDQLERIQEYLQAAGYGEAVRVEMYNRATKEDERARMRQRPPHLLLTNYQMLEYLLVRPQDRDCLFAGHRCRFVVLDEVHTYRGTLGTHVALLVRRLRAHLRRAKPEMRPFLPIGTSATIRSEREIAPGAPVDRAEREQAVQHFFGKLVGVDPATVKVITESAQKLQPPANASYATVPPPASLIDLSDNEQLRIALCRLAGVPETTSLSEAGQRCRLLWDLRSWMGERARSIGGLAHLLAERVPDRAEWREEDRRHEIQVALAIGADLPDDVPASLPLRVHGFVRGGWQFHRCIDPSCGTLHPKGEVACIKCGRPTAPLYLCRHCGADFLRMAGPEEPGGSLEPFPEASGNADAMEDTGIKEWLLFQKQRWTWTDADADEEAEDEDDDNAVPKKKAKKAARLYEVIEGSFDPDSSFFDPNPDTFPHRVALWPTRKRCPACQNSGPRAVITRVSLGTSAAVKVLAEGLLESLPRHADDPKKRLLVFCDSRQDAAHQARFIAYARRYDRMRNRVIRLLTDRGPLSIQKLVEGLGQLGFENKDNPLLPKIGRPVGETLNKVRAWEEAPLLDDLAVNTRYRATLENLGLVRVVYQGVQELVSQHGKEIAQGLHIPVEFLPYVIGRFLDTFRRMGALRRPLLTYHPQGVSFPEELRAAQWERRLQNPVGLPMGSDGYPTLRCDIGDLPAGISVKQVWSLQGFRTLAQKVLLQFTQRLSKEVPDADGLERFLRLLAEQSLLVPVKLFGYSKDCTLFQVGDDALELDLATEDRRCRCHVCSLVIPDAPVGAPCSRCSGSLRSFTNAQVEQSRYARRALNQTTEPLDAEEHTAQVSVDKRKEIEDAFKAKDRSTNLLACTPTLEMGIDVGGLDAILLRNVPPRPDNYAQRGGRAGRRSRVGLVVGYARATPHDQYFFDHADEMIAGAVPAPTFLLGNQDALIRHLHSIACGLATPGVPSRMGDFINFEGKVQQEVVDQFKAGLAATVDPSLQIALDAFGGDVLTESGFTAERLREGLVRFPDLVQNAIDRTAVQVSKLRSALDVLYTTGERKREANRTVDLINRLLGNITDGQTPGDDAATAYPLRRFAEFGLLPGYEFPSEPATLRLMGDGDESNLIQSGRELGLRQYQPNAPVYARGRRWKVIGVDLASPWNPAAGQASWQYTRCRNCDLIRDAQTHPKCPRCGNAGAGGEQPAMAYAGYLARLDNTAVADEEDRWGAKDNVQLHPSWTADQVAGRWRMSDGFSLEWRRGELLYWLNEGPEIQGAKTRYRLCPDCGKLLTPAPAPEPSKKKGSKAPVRSGDGPDPFGHGANCPRKGQDVAAIALYSQRQVETLRLLFPWAGSVDQEERLQEWTWTLGYALLAGAERLFALSSRDFEVVYEGVRVVTGAGGEPTRQGILTFIDPNLGGSGYLERFAQRLADVAAGALHHLVHDGCESACYRCLKSYDNQRHHPYLKWPLVISTLEGLREETPTSVPLDAADLNDPRPWRAAFDAGVGSPLEHRCLQLLENAGFAPEKQFPILTGGRLITIVDFAFPDQRLAIYVDGASIHLGEVMCRDRRIEHRLKEMEPPWSVLRLRRKDIDFSGQDTLAKIRMLLGLCVK
jgi:replicative superfamily II helicase/very-short-patch-repair endonuclease